MVQYQLLVFATRHTTHDKPHDQNSILLIATQKIQIEAEPSRSITRYEYSYVCVLYVAFWLTTWVIDIGRHSCAGPGGVS